MPDEHISDGQILQQTRLSDDELRDLLQKFNDFLNTLNAAQRRAFMRGQKSLREGAATLHDVSPERLEQFLRKHGPPHGVVCILGNDLNNGGL